MKQQEQELAALTLSIALWNRLNVITSQVAGAEWR
jgi:hypothetical protein